MAKHTKNNNEVPFLIVLLCVVVVYVSIVSVIGRFKNTDMTETQLYLKTIDFILLDFDK